MIPLGTIMFVLYWLMAVWLGFPAEESAIAIGVPIVLIWWKTRL